MQSLYTQNAFAFWLAIAVLLVVVALWAFIAYAKAKRAEAKLDEVFAGVSKDNVAAMLAEYLGTVRTTAHAVDRIQREHDQVAQLMPSVIRHVGLVRFSPFHDTGGDQSFALALLDGQTDGVVITALHSRSDSRLYAKPIQAGASTYALTPEEQQAMEQALNGRARGREGAPASSASR